MDTVAMDVDGLDLSALSADASQFCSAPGRPSDAVTKQFLDRYPLPLLFSALEVGGELENLTILTLEKIFDTSIGSSVILEALSYAGAGLEASSSSTRRMTCLAISKLLENVGGDAKTVHALVASDLVLPLLKAVADRDESVGTSAVGAVRHLGMTPNGIDLLFTEKGAAAGHLKDMATCGSSLVRFRVFSILAYLYGQSKQAAHAIKDSGFLRILEGQLNNTNDVLSQMAALELLYEIAVTSDGARFLAEGSFIHDLIFIMGNNQADRMLRSQAMMVSASLISPDGPLASPISQDDAMKIVGMIDMALTTVRDLENREVEAAIDALGRIGMSSKGAELLLQSPSPVSRHIVQAAFIQKVQGQQVVGIHALASLAGSERMEGPLLSAGAEVSLKDLIFSELQGHSKLSLSDYIWHLLQQAPETRLATYRLIVPLAARPWFWLAICTNKDVINFLTSPHIERTKEGMEWRYACCTAISSSLATSSYRIDATLQEVLEKLQAAVRRGPFLTREQTEAQPLVVTQERF